MAMNNLLQASLNTQNNYLLNLIKIVLVITAFCLINPFTPVMPSGAPLDPSWVIGLNQAVAQKLQFGQELIFTFGPYAAIYTKAFHPATNHLEILGSIYLSALYIFALLLVIKRVNFVLPLGICILFAGFITHLDPVFYSYALIVGIYCWQSNSAKSNWRSLLITGLLFSGFGLYPLIKGPIFVLYFPIAFLSILLFIWQRRWFEAAIIPVAITFTMACFWLYANQNLSNLPNYFLYLGLLIDGFSQAMSSTGNAWEIFAYVGISGLIAAYIINKRRFEIKGIYLLLVFSLYLFVSFKAGFVRHDGHALMGGEALMLASLLLVLILPSRSGYILLLLALVVFLKIEGDYKPGLTNATFEQIQRTYRSTWEGAKVRIFEPKKITNEFEQTLHSLNQLTPLPKLSGTSDIYPFDQTYLIASGNPWNPRPVFQSYHAYTDKLANKNKAFLDSANAPDNVFFRIESIDGRFPTGDDGASWPTLLSQYQANTTVGQYLILKKKSGPSTPGLAKPVSSSTHQLNDWVSLPLLDQPIWASVDIQQSWIGKIKSLLFKSSPLGISVKLEDDSVKQFRFVAGNFRPPVLLSPLIESTQEFNLLYGDMKSLNNKRIKAISIWADGSYRDWEKTYELTLTTNR